MFLFITAFLMAFQAIHHAGEQDQNYPLDVAGEEFLSSISAVYFGILLRHGS
jgi:hypothetical protein